jgi:hypothetical protein
LRDGTLTTLSGHGTIQGLAPVGGVLDPEDACATPGGHRAQFFPLCLHSEADEGPYHLDRTFLLRGEFLDRVGQPHSSFFIDDWVIFAVALQVEGAKVLVFEFLVVDVVVKAESRILKRSRNNLAADFVAPFEQGRYSLRFFVGGEMSSLSFSTMARQRLSARVQWTSIASASTGSLLRQ